MRFPIRFKLYAIGLVPMIVLLFYTLQSAFDELENVRESKHLYHFAEFTMLASGLIHHLQLERGTSVTLLEQASGTAEAERLDEQYQRTDRALQIFENALVRFSQERYARHADIAKLHSGLASLRTMRQNVRERKVSSNTAFDYYSMLNRRLISVISEYTLYSPDRDITLDANAIKDLILLQEQAGQERALLGRIYARSSVSPDDFRKLQELITAQTRLAAEIKNHIVDPELKKRFEAILNDAAAQTLHEYRTHALQVFERHTLLSELKSLAGYGGMIHMFKNYVLRGEEQYYRRFVESYDAFRDTLWHYQALAVGDQQEYEWLLSLEYTFKAYRAALERIKRFHAEDRTVSAIDTRVRIDDTEALRAFEKLRGHVLQSDPWTWFDFATHRIDRFGEIQLALVDSLTQTIHKIEEGFERAFWLQSSVGTLVFLAILLIGYLTSRTILRALNGLNEGLSGFFDFIGHRSFTAGRIPVVSNDEIADMTRQVNEQITHTRAHVEQDKDFIVEATEIVKMMQQGDFSEKLYFEPFNPSLVQLRSVFNKMIELIQEKIALQTQELEKINSSLSDQVYHQTVRLQEQLQELSQFKTAINESMLVVHLSPEQTVSGFSDSFAERSGFDAQTLIAKPFETLIAPHKHRTQAIVLGSHLKDGSIYKGVLPLIRKDAGRFFAETTIIPIFDTKSQITEYLGILHDITPIVEARDAAIAAEKSKDEFLSNMSHEIRTPLNAILGFVGILRRRIDDAKALEYLDIIDSSGKSLLGIINDILDFSKIQAGKFSIDHEPFEPIGEFSVTAKLFASKAAEKRLHYLAYIDPNLPACLVGDAIRLKQILSNLLSNAIKFTPDEGTVKLKVGFETGRLVIMVQDSGIGIGEAQQSRIFNAFEQADGSTTRHHGGTGLGLSISTKLAELMGGEITLSSSEGKGSVFTLTVPCELCTQLRRREHHYDKIRALRIGFVEVSETYRPLMQLIERYFKDFGVTQIDASAAVETGNADLLIFVPEPGTLQRVVQSGKPAIALLCTHGVELERDYPQLFTLAAPFIPTDVMEAFDDATIERLRAVENASSERAALRLSGHVLIAEDNPTNQMLLSMLLEEYGLSFIIADDGAQALEAFEREPFDLVLMDENMPNLNGLEALKRMREFERRHGRSPTPVAAVTANVMPGDRERFLAEGMDAFIAKPIENDELEAVLKHFLKERS